MLAIIALSLTACCLCLTGERRIERALPMTVILWMGALSLLAAADRLAWADGLFWAAIAAVLLWALWMAYKGKGGWMGRSLLKRAVTPGLAALLLYGCGMAYACSPMVVWWGDDLLYWALTPKALWLSGGLTDALGSFAPDFGNYTPGMPVLQWLSLRVIGQWQESALYFTLYFSYGLFLMPLFEKLDWKGAWKIPLAVLTMLVVPVLCSLLSYTFLGVDTALAALFAATLLTLDGDKPDGFAAAVMLCGLALLKQSGLLLALAAFSYWLFKGGKANRRFGLIWLAPLGCYGAWMLFCSLSGLTGVHTSRLAVLAVPAEQWQALLSAFGYALTHLPRVSSLMSALPLLPLPRLAWLGLWIFAPLLTLADHRRSRRACLWSLGLCAFYLLAILLSFHTIFANELNAYTGDQQDNLSLLMERYLAPLNMGLLALNLKWAAERFAGAKRGLRGAMLALAAAVLVLCVNWGSLAHQLIPARYEDYGDVLVLSAADRTEEAALWADDFDDRQGQVVLIGFSDHQEYMENLNYTYAPARFVFAGDGLDSGEAVRKAAADCHATLLLCLDDACALYQGLSELYDGPDTYALYTISAEGEVEDY